MSKTIKELADSLGVSKTAIRKRFTGDFKAQYVETTDEGSLLISDEGCELIARSMRKHQQTATNQDTETAATENSAVIIELMRQLSVKDKQIEELTELLKSSQTQIQALTDALTAAQALHAGTIQNALTEHSRADESIPEDAPRKRHWWNRRKG